MRAVTCLAVVILAALAVIPAVSAAEAAATNTVEKAGRSAGKKPRKLAEYTQWEQATNVAAQLNQPILAFFELKGEPNSSKLRNLAFNPKMLKEFVEPNAVYYHCAIPAARQTPQQKRQKEPPKPLLNEIRESELAVIKELVGNHSVLPMVAVCAPDGKKLGVAVPYADGPVIGNFINDLKLAFEAGQYDFSVSPKLMKLIAEEAKKLEKAKKARR